MNNFNEAAMPRVDQDQIWARIADPTIADAVLDRLVHNAHRLALKEDSMRKATAQRANLDAAKIP